MSTEKTEPSPELQEAIRALVREAVRTNDARLVAAVDRVVAAVGEPLGAASLLRSDLEDAPLTADGEFRVIGRHQRTNEPSKRIGLSPGPFGCGSTFTSIVIAYDDAQQVATVRHPDGQVEDVQVLFPMSRGPVPMAFTWPLRPGDSVAVVQP